MSLLVIAVAAADAESAAQPSDAATAIALVVFAILSLVTFYLAAHCNMRPFHRHG